MDILQKLTQIQDINLQNLLSHSMRYAHQHTNIAAHVESQKTEDKDHEMRNKQAAAIHRDTALLMNELVKKILEMVPTPEATDNLAKQKRNSKKASQKE